MFSCSSSELVNSSDALYVVKNAVAATPTAVSNKLHGTSINLVAAPSAIDANDAHPVAAVYAFVFADAVTVVVFYI